MLGVKISLHAQSQASGQQILAMEVTDSEDPLFLYTLSCSE
jgi:hypothetical protein